MGTGCCGPTAAVGWPASMRHQGHGRQWSHQCWTQKQSRFGVGVQTSSPHAKKPLGNPPAINLLTRLVHWALESCNGSQGAGVLRTGQVQDIKITICGGESIGFLCNQLIPQVANFLLPLRCVHFSESLVLSIIRRFSQPRPLTIFSWH